MNFRTDIRHHSSGQLSLTDGEIHVWQVELSLESSRFQKLFETLSPDEKQKAEKYRFEKDRNLFVTTRGSLRKILGAYLGVLPEQIRFFYNRFGKPFLKTENHQIRFNVSHSQDIALIAVTRGREIGIDIEFKSDVLTVLSIAEKSFSTEETSRLKNLSSNLQTDAFFSIWTRKEAILKAIGEGFSFSPKQFSVSVMAKERETLSIREDFQKVRHWSLMNLPAAPDYAAALAVEGNIGKVRYWQ